MNLNINRDGRSLLNAAIITFMRPSCLQYGFAVLSLPSDKQRRLTA